MLGNGGLRGGDARALALEHELALELSERREHCPDQPARPLSAMLAALEVSGRAEKRQHRGHTPHHPQGEQTQEREQFQHGHLPSGTHSDEEVTR